MDAGRELLVVLFIVAVPTVPVCLYVLAVLGRRRQRGLEPEVASGRPAETPFVLLTWVGTAIALTAVVAVAVTLLARTLA